MLIYKYISIYIICYLWWIISFPRTRSVHSERRDKRINFTTLEMKLLIYGNFSHFSLILQSLFYLCSDIPADAILELFGKTFFEFCQDSGYDKILQVLGATPRDFLQVNFMILIIASIRSFSFFPLMILFHIFQTSKLLLTWTFFFVKEKRKICKVSCFRFRFLLPYAYLNLL